MLEKYINLNFELTDNRYDTTSSFVIQLELNEDGIHITVPKPYKLFSEKIVKLINDEWPMRNIIISFMTNDIVSIFDHYNFRKRYLPNSV